MPASELLQEGGWLMLMGMGIVFTFLVVLVFGLQAMSRLAHWIEGKQPHHAVPTTTEAEPSPPGQTLDDELVTVIAAAISRFRGTRP